MSKIKILLAVCMCFLIQSIYCFAETSIPNKTDYFYFEQKSMTRVSVGQTIFTIVNNNITIIRLRCSDYKKDEKEYLKCSDAKIRQFKNVLNYIDFNSICERLNRQKRDDILCRTAEYQEFTLKYRNNGKTIVKKTKFIKPVDYNSSQQEAYKMELLQYFISDLCGNRKNGELDYWK